MYFTPRWRSKTKQQNIGIGKQLIFLYNNLIANCFQILKTFIDKMKEKDPLFKKMFTRVFYGGSYYDGLRVGKPEEFDLDLLLSLPKYAEPTITVSKVPGFVHLQLKKYDDWMRQPEAMPTYRTFGNLFDNNHVLSTDKVLSWMEGIVQKAMNDFPQKGSKRIISNKNGAFEVS